MSEILFEKLVKNSIWSLFTNSSWNSIWKFNREFGICVGLEGVQVVIGDEEIV